MHTSKPSWPSLTTYITIPQVLADAGLADPAALAGGSTHAHAAGGSTATREGAHGAPEIQPAAAEPAGPGDFSAAAAADASGGGGVSSAAAATAEVLAGAPGVTGAATAEAEGVGRLEGDLLALVVGQSRQMGRMINVRGWAVGIRVCCRCTCVPALVQAVPSTVNSKTLALKSRVPPRCAPTRCWTTACWTSHSLSALQGSRCAGGLCRPVLHVPSVRFPSVLAVSAE